MKKVLFFLCFVCAMKFVSAQTYWDICKGETFYWGVTENTTDTVIYFSSFSDSISYINNRVYDTIVGNILSAVVDTDMIYEVVSVNGIPPEYPKKLVITVLPISTISIPPASIHHVTCPDGYLYPYMDGSFHVTLDDPISDYDFIDIFNDSTYFFYQTYDSVTLTGLRGGTYHVVAYGINGCEYHDSLVIEQPDPWVDLGCSFDTVCFGQTGCAQLELYGGTPQYDFTWFYYADTGQVFMVDTTNYACGLHSGVVYFVYMYDSRGCKFLGEETDYIFFYLYEYVEDSTHIITTDSIACYGREFIVQAQSIGEGTYTWYVGDVIDSVNYWTGVYGDSLFVADYFTPPITEPTWIYAEFSDQHHCVTRDSVWVEVSHPEVSLVEVPDHLCSNGSFPMDLADYTEVTPDGGSLLYYGESLSGNGEFSPANSGPYMVYANYTDSIGCVAQDSIIINVVDPEPVVLAVDTLMFTDSLYHITAPAGGTMTIDGVNIPEAGGQFTIDPNQFSPGYYTLHFEAILGDYGCLSEYETTIHIIDRTSVRDFGMAVSVYPNPATTVLNLSGTELMDITVSVTDITGRTLRTEKVLDMFHTLDVSALPSGVYLLRMEIPTGAEKVVKFVKR